MPRTSIDKNVRRAILDARRMVQETEKPIATKPRLVVALKESLKI